MKKIFLILITVCLAMASCHNTAYKDSVKNENDEVVVYMPEGKRIISISCTGNSGIPVIIMQNASETYIPQTYEMYKIDYMSGEVYLSEIIKEQ